MLKTQTLMFEVFSVLCCLFSHSKKLFCSLFGPSALWLGIGPSAGVFETCDVTYGEERRCSTKRALKVFMLKYQSSMSRCLQGKIIHNSLSFRILKQYCSFLKFFSQYGVVSSPTHVPHSTTDQQCEPAVWHTE